MKIKIIILVAVVLVLVGVGYYYKVNSWNNYTNKEYGFTVSFPESWKGVKIEEEKGNGLPIVSHFSFDFDTKTEWWPSSSATLWNIFVYEKDAWYQSEEMAEQHVRKLGENDSYVFGSYGFQDAPDDLVDAVADLQELIGSFKVLD